MCDVYVQSTAVWRDAALQARTLGVTYNTL